MKKRLAAALCVILTAMILLCGCDNVQIAVEDGRLYYGVNKPVEYTQAVDAPAENAPAETETAKAAPAATEAPAETAPADDAAADVPSIVDVFNSIAAVQSPLERYADISFKVVTDELKRDLGAYSISNSGCLMSAGDGWFVYWSVDPAGLWLKNVNDDPSEAHDVQGWRKLKVRDPDGGSVFTSLIIMMETSGIEINQSDVISWIKDNTVLDAFCEYSLPRGAYASEDYILVTSNGGNLVIDLSDFTADVSYGVCAIDKYDRLIGKFSTTPHGQIQYFDGYNNEEILSEFNIKDFTDEEMGMVQYFYEYDEGYVIIYRSPNPDENAKKRHNRLTYVGWFDKNFKLQHREFLGYHANPRVVYVCESTGKVLCYADESLCENSAYVLTISGKDTGTKTFHCYLDRDENDEVYLRKVLAAAPSEIEYGDDYGKTITGIDGYELEYEEWNQERLKDMTWYFWPIHVFNDEAVLLVGANMVYLMDLTTYEMRELDVDRDTYNALADMTGNMNEVLYMPAWDGDRYFSGRNTIVEMIIE